MKTKTSGAAVGMGDEIAASRQRYYALSGKFARTLTRSMVRSVGVRSVGNTQTPDTRGRAKLVVALLFACLASQPWLVTTAAESATPRVPTADAPPPPPLPARSRESSPASEPESGLEPEVSITTRGEATHEEYRVNGKLYMIKVIPKQGKPYYLIDDEGGGQFRRSDIETRMAVPNWVIKRW